MKAYSSSGSVV